MVLLFVLLRVFYYVNKKIIFNVIVEILVGNIECVWCEVRLYLLKFFDISFDWLILSSVEVCI